MDFEFSAEDTAFRNELRTFIESELPSWWDDVQDVRESPQFLEAQDSFRKKLAAKGWLAMAWPKEYGGQSASVLRQTAFSEVVASYGAPAGGQGVAWIGPAILIYGTEEQKSNYLLKITGAEVEFCTLYTEPGAGSDLAAMSTSAVRDGDSYVINGHKVFNSNADIADFGWLAARTDPDMPKHRGISLFVIDMTTPGIVAQPMRTMADTDTSSEVYFDDARVPASALVGEENRGWYQMAVSLDFERSGIDRVSQAGRVLSALVGHVKDSKTGADLSSSGQSVRSELGQIAIQVEVGRHLSYQVASLQEREEPFSYQASVAKVYGTELALQVCNVGIRALGLFGQLRRDSAHARLRGRYAFEYLYSWGSMFGAGTSEIQRTIIATRGLGLPRA